MRREEFAAACKILNVSRGMVLDYPDGQLHRLDMQRVVSDLILRMREFRPQVLLTFDPAGGVTGHTDHTMASVFATLAFHWAGRSNRFPDQLSGSVTPQRIQKLYHATADFTLPGRQPVTLLPATAVIEVGDYLETKIAAFKRAHQPATAVVAVRRVCAETRRAGAVSPGSFGKAGPPQQENDLFAGVTEESV